MKLLGADPVNSLSGPAEKYNVLQYCCFHQLSWLLLQATNGVFTRSSKRPAIYVYFEYICWKFAGRLLDRVNTL